MEAEGRKADMAPSQRDSTFRAPLFSEPLHVGRPNIGNRERFDKLVSDMFERQWLTNDGPLVRELEQEIAQSSGVEHCVAMCNGTLALEIAIRALGLSGEVIVPSFTFVATAHALHWQGITPVFADIDPTTHTLDPAAVRRMITPRTSGIIGVHLWGRPADIEGLQQIGTEYSLPVIYDAAHAFGCTYRGDPIAAFGDISVMSFHATKIFNTFEGGAVLTNNDELAEAIRLMRNFGFSGYDNVIHPGTNGKMSEVCAAMGIANLEGVDETIRINRRNHQAYADALSGTPGISVLPYDASEQSNYQYVVLEVDAGCAVTRDDLLHALHRENVLARRYFWPGCHRMKPYRDLFPHAGLLLPHTEAVANGVLVLPTGRAVSVEAIDAIGGFIREEACR
jgi:dTDP-4-amino-4,6-dideoxygalactose transaminase